MKIEDPSSLANNSKNRSGERDDTSQHSKHSRVSRSHDSAFKPVTKESKSSFTKSEIVVTDLTAGAQAQTSGDQQV